ncbi:hypothetical protein HDV01_005508 [Terramyces sp. JEL0728]|nr:hypothetical protein HDV01_005508 [Terramyces sp. JEL0728]
MDYNPIPYCGVDLSYVDIGCCLSSLNMTRTYNYLGYTRNYLTDYSLQESVPKSANGQSYCYISSMNETALFGYQDMYFKTSGDCLEDIFKCYSDRIEIYSDSKCSGAAEIYQTPTALLNVNSQILGNVSISVLTETGGTMAIQWTAFVPGLDLVPNYSEPLEFLSMALFLFTVISIFSLLVWLTRKYIQRKRKIDFWHMLCTMVIIFKMILYLVYQHTIFTDPHVLDVYSFVITITDFASVMSNVTSVMILFTIFTVINPWIKTVTIAVLFMIFFGLEGLGYYTWYLELVQPELFMDYYDLSNTLQNAWSTLSLVFNYIPPLWIFANIIKLQYFKRRSREDFREKSIFLMNRNIFIIIALQVVTGTLICVINFNLFNLVNTDRQYLALGQFVNYITHLHFVLLIALFEELTNVTKDMVSVKIQQPTKQVRLLDVALPGTSETVDQKTVVLKK